MSPLFGVLTLVMTAEAAELPAWMIGCWSDGADEDLTVEAWAQADGNHLFGLNFRSSADGVAFEYLRIELTAGTPEYVAQPGGQPPTRFPLLQASQGYALFANDAHDYPQRIGYRRIGDEMEVWISLADGSRRFAWDWSRTDCREVFSD
ncbi:MAG: DUF6265 family protein [Xanthomonadales bacterium]|nr:DUF6265 family protein [Xanthomonadales bacterium]